MNEEFKFDFDFGGASTAELLDQAKRELLGQKDIMGGGIAQAADEEIRRTEEFFAELQTGTINFPRAHPTVFSLNTDYFDQNKLTVPKTYSALSEKANFYWVEVSVFLVQGAKPFYKMQMCIEFGEGISKGEQIPKVYSAFPESKFAEIASAGGKLDVGLGEDLEFKVAAGIDEVALPASIPLVEASAGGKLAVNAKVASNVGFVAGPFSYSIKRAQVDCRFAGEKVLWTITDKQSLQEKNPVFIVILQVPKDVSQVRLKAQAQAHRAALLPKFIVSLLNKLSPKAAEWLKKGSPVTVTLPPYSHSISTQ